MRASVYEEYHSNQIFYFILLSKSPENDISTRLSKIYLLLFYLYKFIFANLHKSSQLKLVTTKALVKKPHRKLVLSKRVVQKLISVLLEKGGIGTNK